MSVAQTTAKIHSRVSGPPASARASHNGSTQGSAIQSKPSANHRGSASCSRRATQKTIAAPAAVAASAKAMPANTAMMTATRAAAIKTAPVFPIPPPRHSLAHSQAMPMAAIAVRIGSQGEPYQVAAIAIGASTRADRMRSVSRPGSARANRGTVAALAATIIGDRLLKIGTAEIGPQRLGKDELGIGALPQQEIADALFAAGADQKVGSGQIGGEQMRRNQLLVDGIERQSARFRLGSDGTRCRGNLCAAAIGQRDRQVDRAVLAGQRLRVVDQCDDIRRQAAGLADYPQAHTIAMQLRDLAAEVMAQQPHPIVDLVERPLPVFRGKTEQRQIRNAEFGRRRQRAPHRLGATAVTSNARQTAALRPSAVPVHYDGNVPRQ